MADEHELASALDFEQGQYGAIDQEGQEQEQDEVKDYTEYPVHRSDWARVLRSPIKNKKHVIMDVCGAGGDIQRLVFTKANTLQYGTFRDAIYAPLYNMVRRTTWGGLTPGTVPCPRTGVSMSPLMREAKGITESTFAFDAEARRERDGAAAGAELLEAMGGSINTADGGSSGGGADSEYESWLQGMGKEQRAELEAIVHMYEEEQEQERKGLDAAGGGGRRRGRGNKLLKSRRSRGAAGGTEEEGATERSRE